MTAITASKKTPCPLCGREHYCFLIGDPIDKVLCQWTDPNQPPKGWDYLGLAKDSRPMFGAKGRKRSARSRFPELVRLVPDKKADIPDWSRVDDTGTIGPGDLVIQTPEGLAIGRIYQAKRRMNDKRGMRFQCTNPNSSQVVLDIAEKELQIATQDPSNGAELLQIEYLYPDPITQKPFGKVVRRQWSDRRQWMEKFKKTKEVRPYHWSSDAQSWQRGRSDRPWPLYRETEAKEAIIKGEAVFVVAGEQAVECYRQLGLVATTVQGGEARYQEIADRLKDAFSIAKDAGASPLLAIHPDFDLTGESKFANGLVRACRIEQIPAVAMEPLSIWGKMPHGGDIKDVLTDSGLPDSEILINLENAIDEAINHQEIAEQAIRQRERWGAPETLQGELGYYREKDGYSFFNPLTNFDLQIEKEVASRDGGGFVLQVKRAGEHRQYRLFLPSLDFTSNVTFENTLKKALGGALICRLNTNQMKALLRVRLHEYHSRGGKLYRLAERSGQQDDGHWIFPRSQLTPGGRETTEEESRWIWNDNLTGETSTLPIPKTNPDRPSALADLVEVMRRFFGRNIYPALLTLGYAAASLHYKEFIEKSGAFPILNLIGDAGSGKTTAATCALSLVGMHTEKAGGLLRSVSVSAAYERLKITGGLLHCIDDPDRTPQLDEFLKGLYNGKVRLVRGKDTAFNSQHPHSALMVTSNFACGETNAATMSRLVQLWFDVDKPTEESSKAYDELSNCWESASGAMAELIRIGYDPNGISDTEKRLRPHLPHAHSRMARSLAILLSYAERITHLTDTDMEIDLMGYVKKHVCSMANDADSSTDSLRDFIEKLSVLRSQTKVGEWNMRFILERNSSQIKCLAVNLPSVWAILDKQYKLPYNYKILKHLLKTKGIQERRQRFHRDEDLSRAFERDQAPDPKWTLKRCIEIPIELIKDYIEMSEEGVSMSTASTEDAEETETLASQRESLLTNNNNNMSTACQQSQQSFTEELVDKKADDSVTKKEGFCDRVLSITQSHTGQEIEGNLEPLLTPLTQKTSPPKCFTQTSETVTLDTPSASQNSENSCSENWMFDIGDKVEIQVGRFQGRIVPVVGFKDDRIQVRAESWRVTHDYAANELLLV